MRLAECSTWACKFCGGEVNVGRVLDDADVPAELVGGTAVLHYEPQCDVFRDTDPADFVSASLGRAQANAAGGAS